MKMNDETLSGGTDQSVIGVVNKRPYEKPAFSRESVFETMALACGKVRGQGQDACRRVTSAS